LAADRSPEGEAAPDKEPIPLWIGGAFLLSGFGALIYQVVWQRVLFATFGINVQAVAVIVTAFLVGLGLGSLAGGMFSAKPERRLLAAFAGIEFCVGVFGLVSVPLFRTIGEELAGLPFILTGLATVALVLMPTLLMGATLPLLVAYGVRRSGNVGRSVGWLYFVNTAGSAIAAISAAVFVMGAFGEMRSTWLAAAANFIVSATATVRSISERSRP
jgi:predicted membrane-bound spermidine synthase